MDKEITEYVEAEIIPRYRGFDKAHAESHSRRTIENSLKIAEEHKVDLRMVYVVAAYHDLGLAQGRKDHEKNSARHLLADERLKEWFSPAELNLMAEAIEDHRSSTDHEPRSIYGKIVADADNDLTYMSILTRCVQYGISAFPEYDKEKHYTRIVEHMKDKYGHAGYLKLWLNSEHDRRGLQDIWHKLYDDQAGLRADFDVIYEELEAEKC